MVHRIVRGGSWDSWSPAFMVGKQVTGARLGIIGMGRVGSAFAQKARGLEMDIHYFNRSKLPRLAIPSITYKGVVFPVVAIPLMLIST